MIEAENSIAAKKRASITRWADREHSPTEVYSPKRKSSDYIRIQESPPPYIPSRKDFIKQCNSCSCNRHRPSQDDSCELVSKYQGEELLHIFGIGRDSMCQLKYFRSQKSEMAGHETKKDFSCKREVKSDNSSSSINNFQITTCMLSSELQSTFEKCCSKMQQQSPSPVQTQLMTLSPVINANSRISATARLGKLVVERKDLAGVTDVNSRIRQSKSRIEYEEDDVSTKREHSKLIDSQRRIFNCGRVVQEKPGFVSMSSKAEPVNEKKELYVNSSDKAIQKDTCTKKKRDDCVDKNITCDNAAASISFKCGPTNEMSSFSIRDSEAEDLAKIIDEDLSRDLFNDTHDVNINLPVDCDNDDDDVSNVAGRTENGTVRTDIKEHEIIEKQSGIRFIVTLDGVDETQFGSENKCGLTETFKCPLLSASKVTCMEKHKLLDIIATRDRIKPQRHLPDVKILSPTAITLSKRPTFTMNLQSSDEKNEKSPTKRGYYHQVEDVIEEESVASVLKRAKQSERCKFWPACAAGISCEYHHPIAHCKLFPDCKFGDKCLFIHPNCRFDSKCVRPDCPYTHTSRRPSFCGSSHLITIPKPKYLLPPFAHKSQTLRSGYNSPQIICRYFPNCQNMNCQFLHPKPCRFDLSCKNPACPFSHSSVFDRKTLKWHAGNDHKKTNISTLLASVKTGHVISRPSKTSYSTTISSTSQ